MIRRDPERGPSRPEHVADVPRHGAARPPTSFGTRIVVSESGVILSPKYAPQMTAPAAAASESPITCAIPTNATPSVPAVVHELPVTIPTIAQIAAVAKKKIVRVEQLDAVVDDRRDRAGHVPGADQRADGEQDEDRARPPSSPRRPPPRPRPSTV